MRLLGVAVLALGLLWAIADAHAACRVVNDCSTGICRQTQICQNLYDMPVMAPAPSVPPIVSPSIQPIMPPAMPPIGTSSCQPMRVCNNFGQCAWQQVCR